MMRRLSLVAAFLTVAVSPALFAQGGAATARKDTVRGILALDRVVAVVGRKAITLFELYERINEENARRQEAGQPPLSGDSLIYMNTLLVDMMDNQLLLQKAEEFKFPIKEEDLTATADRQIKQIQGRFPNDSAFRAALKEQGLASADELKRQFIQQGRERQLVRMTLDTLGKLGQMPTVNVSEKDIQAAFDSIKKSLPPRGLTMSFRQIVVKPVPSDSADARAKALADSLLTLLKAGANFDSLAMRFSADTAGGDSSSAKQGGDLGWHRRGDFDPAFERAVFSLQINQLAPVTKSQFGYHVIKADRVRPGEVRSRHILIQAQTDARDVVRAHLKAERVLEAWKKGASYDSLADADHDPGQYPFLHSRRKMNLPVDSLPKEYVDAIKDLKPGEFSTVFDVVMPDGSPTKAGVLQALDRNESGEWTLAETRERIRQDLQQAGSWRRLLDTLRKQTYVSVRLVEPPPRSSK